MKVLKWLLLVVALLLAGFTLGRDLLIKQAVRRIIARETGFGVTAGQISVGVLSSTVRVRDLRLTNPGDFPRREFLDIHEIEVRYRLRSLFGPEIHLNKVVLDVPQVVVVKKADGETNLTRLQAAVKKREAGPEPAAPTNRPAPAPAGAERPPKAFRIDLLVLRIGTLEYAAYPEKGDAVLRKIEVKTDREFRDVTSKQQLVRILTGEMVNAFGREIESGLRALFKESGGDGKKAEQGFRRAANDIGHTLEGLFKKAKKKD